MSFSKMALGQRRYSGVMPGKWEKKGNFFDTHPLAEVLRGLVYTSLLWGLLAVGVYSVYSIIIGAR